MKFNNILSTLGLLTASFVSASRSSFYGENDNRPNLFKILDDHIGNIKINLDDQVWATMKEKTLLEPWDAGSKGEKYGTTNATMEFYIEGTDYRVQLQPGDFKFRLGGRFTRNFAKPGYNIKIENGDVYDVKTLRLRSSYRDNTLMREKLSTDMLYKLGVPSTSTSYVNVEVNGENLGLFVLTNKIKKDFIKKYFGEKNPKNLYECKEDFARFEDNSIVEICKNTVEKLVDQTEEIQKFVDTVNSAKTIDDLRKVLDVDTFMKTIAFEFLTLSWDHFLIHNHNYYWYKRKDGIWTIILNDFDETWGQDCWPSIFSGDGKFIDKSYIIDDVVYINFPNFSIHDCDMGHQIVKILVHDNPELWREVIANAVKTIFNPEILFNRIDELSELIREDVNLSRQVDEKTGRYPGCFNTIGFDPKWNMTHFDDGTHYTGWAANTGQARGFGLRFLIEERFKYICHAYGIDPETLELINPQPYASYWGILNKYPFEYGDGELYEDEFIKFTFPNLYKEDYMKKEYNTNPSYNHVPPYEE